MEITANNPHTEAAVDTEQLWSVLTLRALEEQLAASKEIEGFVEVRALVDELSTEFARRDPLYIANLFEAVQAVAELRGRTLDDVEGPELTALT